MNQQGKIQKWRNKDKNNNFSNFNSPYPVIIIIWKIQMQFNVVRRFHIRGLFPYLCKHSSSTSKSKGASSTNNVKLFLFLVSQIPSLNTNTASILTCMKRKINDVESRMREAFHRNYEALSLPHHSRRVVG